ncbi:MAG: Transposase, Mutator family [Microgenomates group bacterium ADurb.Bin238]|nr:MAG: Transposase, Mutator family [Microgenomates group bacterium ADurb.Bin238]
MISVQTEVEIQGDLSLASISRELDAINIPKEILKSAIVKLQDGLLLELCGSKYRRNQDRKFKRAGSTTRTLTTRHGRIEFKLSKVRCLENGSIMRPLLVYVGVEPKKRIIDDLTLECAEIATYLTYRDSKMVIENLTNAKVSRCGVHRCVQSVGEFMNSQRRKSPVKSQDLILGDGTKCHGLGGKKNEINVILGKNQATGEKSLLGLSVNENWKGTMRQFRGWANVAVSDNEPSLRNALLEKAFNYQACVRHCVGDVRYYLWSADVPKDQRDRLAGELLGILEVLRNSVNKHVADGNFERLRWRISWTLSELDRLGRMLLEAGLPVVARFIKNAANYMVTFARLVMKGVYVPMTNNLVERLMGEIAKRIKNKWMHWSTRGLENLLNILLARYCNRRFYGEMKERYLSPKNTVIQIAIT